MGTFQVILLALAVAALAWLIWWIRVGRKEAKHWLSQQGYIETDQQTRDEQAQDARRAREDSTRALLSKKSSKKIRY
jgi:uncharacterized membrane protein YccC